MNIHEVFALALTDISAASSLQEALRSDLVVPDPYLHRCGVFLYEFLNEHQSLPKPGDWAVWADALPEMQRDGVRGVLAIVRRQQVDHYTADFVVEAAVTDLRNAAAKVALTRMHSLAELTPEALAGFAAEIEAIKPVSLAGLARLRDVDAWIRPPAVEALRPTGFKMLDRWLGGGFGPELIFIMADSGVGKTTILCNFGKSAMEHGARVLHVTLELATHPAMQRYYRRIAEVNKTQIRREVVETTGKVQHWLRYAKGSLSVLFQEAYTLNPESLRALCRQFVATEGGLDTLIIDYIDLMAPPDDAQRLSEYQQLGRISHLVRNFKEEFGCTIISATQSARGASAIRPRLSDMGDSYNKVRAGDGIFALVQTEEELEAHQARLVALKVRESPGKGREIPLYANMDLMSFLDMTSPTTLGVMSRMGHSWVDLNVPPEEVPA